MARKAFDTWKIEVTGFNRTVPYYVQCNCGKLAQKKYQQSYFEC
ncbi:transcriptional regulator, partial [Enterococcus plantarum]